MAINYPQRYDDDFLNTIKTVIDHVNVHGKTIQDLVAEGQLTEEQYAELITVINGLIKSGHVDKSDLTSEFKDEIEGFSAQLAQKLTQGEVSVTDINKNKGKFDQTYLSDELLQQITGTTPVNATPANKSVTTEKIADKAVTPEITTFAKAVNIAGNYVDRLYMSGGSLNATFVNTDGFGSFVTKVEKGRTYTISKNASDRFRIATSIGYPVRNQAPNRYLSLVDSLNEFTVTMQGEEDHIIVYVTSENQPPTQFQIEEGEEATDYAPHGERVIVNHGEKSITQKHLEDTIRPYGYVIGLASQFKVDLKDKKIITSTNGNPVVVVGSKLYPIKSGEWDFSSWSGTSKVVITFNIKNSDIALLEVERLNDKGNDDLVVIGGMHVAAGNYFVNGLHYKDNENEPAPTPTEPINSIFIADNASGNYYYDSSEWYIEPLANRDINNVYGIYDNLVAQFPDYVTKTHLGDDEGGVPLYRYDFKPIEIHKESNSHPKIIYTCTHGHEASATYGGALFFRDLCKNWKTSPIKRLLRWNIHFIVIPNLNPWGFNNSSRPNFNGVDLARNFSAGWEFNDTEEYRFSGNEPLSEFGTQTMDQLLQQNKDALFVLDHHNYGGDPTDGSTLMWTGALDKDIQIIERQYIHNNVVQMKERFPDDIPEGLKLGTTADAVRGGSLTSQVHSHGIRGMILECGHKINNSYEKGQTFNADSVGNAIVSVIKYFSK